MVVKSAVTPAWYPHAAVRRGSFGNAVATFLFQRIQKGIFIEQKEQMVVTRVHQNLRIKIVLCSAVIVETTTSAFACQNRLEKRFTYEIEIDFCQ